MAHPLDKKLLALRNLIPPDSRLEVSLKIHGLGWVCKVSNPHEEDPEKRCVASSGFVEPIDKPDSAETAIDLCANAYEKALRNRAETARQEAEQELKRINGVCEVYPGKL